MTDYHPGQQAWSKDNMPAVLYMLLPSLAWHRFKHSGRPPAKRDINGDVILEPYPQPGKAARQLLDFDILVSLHKHRLT